MKLEADQQRWRATDLSDFSACRYKTVLEREQAHGRLKRPGRADPAMRLLQERGLEHEGRYRRLLEQRHGEVAFRVPGSPPTNTEEWAQATQRTVAAMRAGHRVIYQAPLALGRWSGFADFLVRKDADGDSESASELGPFHYEVVDTKLAQEAKASAVLQLCVYSHILGTLQGCLPEFFYVVSPSGVTPAGEPSAPREHVFRSADYLAYFRVIRERFERFAELGTEEGTYPEPVEHCDVCAWWQLCDERRREDDHLSLVAGMSRSHRRLLEEAGIETLAALGQVSLPQAHRPKKLPVQSFERLHHQARLQLEARASAPRFEMLPVENDRGLCRLPAPSPGDVFFDIEADRYASDGTFHYLLGWVLRGPAGTLEYQGLWASTRREEQQNFERFMDVVVERRRRYRDLHIYHFAPFEKTALGAMMGRFASRQDELDDLLRNEVLVDLMPVVKQALRAGIESYSLKELERFYRFERSTDLRAASRARRLFELARELGGAQELPEVISTIESYNRDDCISTAHLQSWLEEQRSALVGSGTKVPRPELKAAEPPEAISAWSRRVEQLRKRLTDGVPLDPEAPTDGERARLLLADLLDWHRREDKPGWWEHFRVRALAEDELIDDSATIGGLGPEQPGEAIKRSRLYAYAFPEQEFGIKVDNKVECPITEQKVGTVVEVRRQGHAKEHVIVVKRAQELPMPPRGLVAENDAPNAVPLQNALAEIGAALAPDFGLQRPEAATGTTFSAARALLLRTPPRLADGSQLRRPDESAAAALSRVAPLLQGSVLAVQGPPGAGKTYCGSRMILELVKAGKKVGITAQSHAVIENLLGSIHEAASEAGVPVFSIQKPKSGNSAMPHPCNAHARSNADVQKKLATGEAQIAAGTAWLWCAPELRQAVDVLVVDEAGQFSLANTLAVSVAADSMVLLGDPQQLAQPSKGSHPPGAEASALEHLLNNVATIPAELGLFLEETWRLPPTVTEFTSRYFYSGRLRSQAGCAAQRLHAPGSRFDGTGLFFEAIEHQGNVNCSEEEATRIAEIVTNLLASRATWVTRKGDEPHLTLNDILVVAPYNLQVHQIDQALTRAGFPGARVGTVDKFQGQEAPVVIYSMTTSHPEDAPKGLDFLFSLNRLNVATSRTQAVAIIVGSPALLEADCKTPKQMRLVNGLCGAVEVARGPERERERELRDGGIEA